MSALAASCGMSVRVTFGSRATDGGWSHSWVTPTSADSSPSAHTISVALGSRDTIRIVCGARAPHARARQPFEPQS